MNKQMFLLKIQDIVNIPVEIADFPLYDFKIEKQCIIYEDVKEYFDDAIDLLPENPQRFIIEELFFIWTAIKYSQHLKLHLNDLRDHEWQDISTIVGKMSLQECKLKWFSKLQNNNIQKVWETLEDELLRAIIIENNMEFHWNTIAQEIFNRSMGKFNRKGKQYRERWNNHLNPDMKRGIWTEEEDIRLLEITLQFGLKWSRIAKILKQRTENAVKNRFKSLLNQERKLSSINRTLKSDEDEKKQCTQSIGYAMQNEQIELAQSIIDRIKNSQQKKPQTFQQQEQLHLLYLQQNQEYLQQQNQEYIQQQNMLHYYYMHQQMHQMEMFKIQQQYNPYIGTLPYIPIIKQVYYDNALPPMQMVYSVFPVQTAYQPIVQELVGQPSLQPEQSLLQAIPIQAPFQRIQSEQKVFDLKVKEENKLIDYSTKINRYKKQNPLLGLQIPQRQEIQFSVQEQDLPIESKPPQTKDFEVDELNGHLKEKLRIIKSAENSPDLILNRFYNKILHINISPISQKNKKQELKKQRSMTYISDHIIENENGNDNKSEKFIRKGNNQKKNSRYFFEALKKKEQQKYQQEQLEQNEQQQ